ncbi:hypothetical protein [Piscirickettsia salmonis]|uniref:hypothetical protein n=1 Tax=Piscirickettsia salmonis TaxID=1238 RepID=UPI0007D781F9|nr:hypothetical protein A0O36_02054 [Piscirickettsiaceae bacterium NZ-RLO1]
MSIIEKRRELLIHCFSTEVQECARNIAIEMQNGNSFPHTNFENYLRNKKIHSTKLVKLVSDELNHILLEKLYRVIPLLGAVDDEKVTSFLCRYIIQEQFRNIDSYCSIIMQENLNHETVETTISAEHKHKQPGLYKLENENFTLKSNVIEHGNNLLYPHQFMRRHYSSNFNNLITLLSDCCNSGLNTYIRVDPFRKSNDQNLKNIITVEKMLWYGNPFSLDALSQKKSSEKTVYSSDQDDEGNIDCITVFRCDYVEKNNDNLIQWTVNEYKPISDEYNMTYCVQKFAHFIFDASKGKLTHLDGAVKVFDTKKYQEYFKKIQSKPTKYNKIGKRFKLFLVEGLFDLSIMQSLISSWFENNININEYFSGDNTY